MNTHFLRLISPHALQFYALVAMNILAALPSLAATDPDDGETTPFITRRGDQLWEGDKPFRFISMNIPNLQVVEDNFSLDANTPWGWPNEFELSDAMQSVRQMGGRVARTYVLGVRREGSDMGDHVYVLGPGEFNEEAFRTLDLAIEVAGRHGIRLIIPLVDNWKWHGGVAEYAAFRGKTPKEFWTDEQLIADFEATIRFVLARVNSRTGVPYRDDPAILAWETGNELDSPPAWTRRMAALIKKLDPNHLIVDGYSLHGVRRETLVDPNIDLVTTHHYPNAGDGSYVADILAARQKCRGKKPYFVGEFGFIRAAEIEQVYDTVIQNGVSGALLWSLRYHHRGGGFYWHDEPAGGRVYKAYHWPGSSTGAAYEERRVMEITRAKAYEICGLPSPPWKPPEAPKLLPMCDVAAISWQGSAGAVDYVVQRAEREQGPWQVVGDGVDDSAVQYRPLFNDVSAEPGRAYYYRVAARNEGGVSSPSNVVGPVSVEHRTLIDEGRDLSLTASLEGNVRAIAGGDRRRREDAHRLHIPEGGSVVYEAGGVIRNWSAAIFRPESSGKAIFLHSKDGQSYLPTDVEVRVVRHSETDYNFLPCLDVTSRRGSGDAKWLCIKATGGPIEVSRVQIQYVPR